MKSALEFAITPQLDEDNLIEKQPHEVEGLGHMRCFLSCVGHGVSLCRWLMSLASSEVTKAVFDLQMSAMRDAGGSRRTLGPCGRSGFA